MIPSIALVLAFAEVEAPEAREVDRRLWLVVSAEVGEGTDGLFAKSIRETAMEVVRDAGWTVDVGAPRRVQVAIEATGVEGYGMTYSLAAAGTEPRVIARSECLRCGSDQVIEKVRNDLAAVVDQLPSEAMTLPAPVPATMVAVDTPPPPTRRSRLGALGGVGVASIVAGAVGIAVGAALLGVGKAKTNELGSVDYSVPAGVLLGVGAGLAVAGITMLVVDRRRARRNRARASAWLDSHPAGVSLQLRW